MKTWRNTSSRRLIFIAGDTLLIWFLFLTILNNNYLELKIYLRSNYYACQIWTLNFKPLGRLYIYIYIYIYMYIYFIKHNRHFMSTYFLLDPFEFPYYFYRIRRELIYVLSIVVCIPSTFCPTLGHHQGRIRKYLGDIQLWTIHKSIPPEYDKSNTGIRTDPEENM